DGAGLESSYPNPGELDYRIRDYGAVMVEIIASAVALPMGGPHGTGIMSERHTWIGRRGRRLRIFAATATEGMIEHSCRFISEVGCHTNGLDRAIMSQPSFPGRQAAGILQAYAALARAHLGWTYDYSIAAGTARTI
ncbi:MAG TPA: hypothetical protein VEZ12_09320, partial [Herpetosiphonaceae bacterium]|nr:hypothetical protein [Herpetosiphonaceae bacterium]